MRSICVVAGLRAVTIGRSAALNNCLAKCVDLSPEHEAERLCLSLGLRHARGGHRALGLRAIEQRNRDVKAHDAADVARAHCRRLGSGHDLRLRDDPPFRRTPGEPS